MDLKIKQKFALITGAGRGLGRAMATALAQEGVNLCLVSRTKSDLDELLSELNGKFSGLKHIGYALDLTDLKNVDQLRQNIESEFPQLDILVHNVGGNLGISDPFCSLDDWYKIWRFNFDVAVELNRHFVPKMQKNKWGRVVHVTSIAALENQGAITYCAVKAALTAYARGLGRIVASDNVIVTSVLPGAVFTEGGYWDETKQKRPEHYEKFLKDRMAIGRFGQPSEIGNVVAFLCSEHASFMVGSMVPVDGGQGRVFYQW